MCQALFMNTPSVISVLDRKMWVTRAWCHVAELTGLHRWSDVIIKWLADQMHHVAVLSHFVRQLRKTRQVTVLMGKTGVGKGVEKLPQAPFSATSCHINNTLTSFPQPLCELVPQVMRACNVHVLYEKVLAILVSYRTLLVFVCSWSCHQSPLKLEIIKIKGAF